MILRFVLLASVVAGVAVFSSAANAAGDGKVCGGPIGAAPYTMDVWTQVAKNGTVTVWTKPASKPFSSIPPSDARVIPDQVPNEGPQGSKQVLAKGPFGSDIPLFVVFAEGNAHLTQVTTGRSTGPVNCPTG